MIQRFFQKCAQLSFLVFRIMSDQDNLLGQTSDNSSQSEDHFLNLPDQEAEPMEESGATFGGLRLPPAFGG